MSKEAKQEFINYLDSHREDIKYARKGYLKKIVEDFETSTNYKLTASQIKRLVSIFRMTHNCPIEYVPDYHYKPNARTGFCNYKVKTDSDD